MTVVAGWYGWRQRLRFVTFRSVGVFHQLFAIAPEPSAIKRASA
jgi:hypothetical protein